MTVLKSSIKMFCQIVEYLYICALQNGRLTQRFRVLPLQGRSRRFESCSAHFQKSFKDRFLRNGPFFI